MAYFKMKEGIATFLQFLLVIKQHRVHHNLMEEADKFSPEDLTLLKKAWKEGSEGSLPQGVKYLDEGVEASIKINSILETFTKAEQKIIKEVELILNSEELNILRKAAEEGKHASVTIRGRTFTFEPDIPSGKGFYAITNSDTKGFHLGIDAFQNKIELTKTLLHELHRLEFSKVVKTGTVNQSIAKETTNNANDFANKVYDLVFKTE